MLWQQDGQRRPKPITTFDGKETCLKGSLEHAAAEAAMLNRNINMTNKVTSTPTGARISEFSTPALGLDTSRFQCWPVGVTL